MTWTLTRYISRLFTGNLTAVVLGFAGLLQLLDLLNNADRLFARHGDSLWVLARYAMLRTPEVTGFVLPFSVLLATLLTLARLAQNSEILAAKAAGLSFYRILLCFVPAAALVAVINFYVVDRATPLTQRILIDWDAEADSLTDEPAADTSEGVWIRDGLSLVRVSLVLNQGRELHDVTFFVRDDGGNLAKRITADVALYLENGRWQLYDVETLVMERHAGGEFSRQATDVWEGTLKPGHYADIVAPPTSLTLEQLESFTRAEGEIGNRPDYYYETWRHKRYAVPVAVFIMMILAAPMAQTLRRTQRMAMGLAAGVGMGFLYFVTDGVCQALGETGAIPAAVAAWSPGLLFLSFGLAGLIRIEGY
ncbi:MAG: LPS export ABC transporter permease LptG [Dongiaceae bacterium]